MQAQLKFFLKIFFISFLCSSWTLVVSDAQACRFWIGIGQEVPENLIQNQLFKLPNSLKFLGMEYSDGWSLGYYNDQNKAIVFRSTKPSFLDKKYDKELKYLAQRGSPIVFGHLRRASSGCVEGVDNPHPFKRQKNQKNWLFAHNGGMKKQILIDLIGQEYLDDNPPGTCTDNPPDSWVDSELYFIFILKIIEEHDWNVEEGLQVALTKLYEVIDEDSRYLNFFLSDGEKVWAFRKGNSLFYKQYTGMKVSLVSSTIPNKEQGRWKEFPENEIAVLDMQNNIKFIPLIP